MSRFTKKKSLSWRLCAETVNFCHIFCVKIYILIHFRYCANYAKKLRKSIVLHAKKMRKSLQKSICAKITQVLLQRIWSFRWNPKDRTVVAYGCRKRKKLICGLEGKNVVAFGRLPSPALTTGLWVWFTVMELAKIKFIRWWSLTCKNNIYTVLVKNGQK